MQLDGHCPRHLIWIGHAKKIEPEDLTKQDYLIGGQQ
jgi:hypothetical protein